MELREKNKKNLLELKRLTLINILSAKGIIYTHYKNKQKKQRGKYEKNNIRIQCSKNILC